jgi:hypothetical protein
LEHSLLGQLAGSADETPALQKTPDKAIVATAERRGTLSPVSYETGNGRVQSQAPRFNASPWNTLEYFGMHHAISS